MSDALTLAGIRVCVASSPPDPMSRLRGSGAVLAGNARDCERAAEPELTIERAADLTFGGLGRDLGQAGHGVLATLGRLPEVPTLVVVVAPVPSTEMIEAGDETTPVIVARGLPSELFPANGPIHGLTGDDAIGGVFSARHAEHIRVGPNDPVFARTGGRIGRGFKQRPDSCEGGDEV